MEPALFHYLSGEEVHVGDRVQYRGEYARIVVVSDGDQGEFAPGYEDHSGGERGLMICDDDGNVTFIGEPDGFLEFVERG
jgi:hypothetical protein